MVDGWDDLQQALTPWRDQVLNHPIYDHLDTLDALRTFTTFHVWAVWDFMSLVARLQRDLTTVRVPWTPSRSSAGVVRLINEVKLGEESDSHTDGGWVSHYDLYLAAMDEIGVDTTPVRRTVGVVARLPVPILGPVMNTVAPTAPAGVLDPLRFTLGLCLSGSTLQVAAAFALGREQLIPTMFERVLATTGNTRLFAYYLARHIDVDGELHGPAARRLVEELAWPDGWGVVEVTARRALQQRRALWDAALAAITAPVHASL